MSRPPMNSRLAHIERLLAGLLLVGLTVLAIPIQATAQPDRSRAETGRLRELRSDPAVLQSLLADRYEDPVLLQAGVEVAIPGADAGPFSDPSGVVFERATYIVGVVALYEPADRSGIAMAILVDTGDPLAIDLAFAENELEAVDLDGLSVHSGVDDRDVPFLAWRRGPLLAVVRPVEADGSSADLLRSTARPILQKMAAEAPSLETVSPAKPVDPVDQIAQIGTQLLALVTLIVALRFMTSVVLDRTSARSVAMLFNRQLGRPPPVGDSLWDVSRHATRYRWVVRVVAIATGAAALLALILASITVVVITEGLLETRSVSWTVAVGLSLLVLIVYFGAPIIGRKLVRAVTGGAYEPRLPPEAIPRTRWLRAPFASIAVVIGTLAALVLFIGGLALLLQAAVVSTNGFLLARTEAEASQARTGFFIVALVVLVIASAPFALSRRVAQLSANVSLRSDQRPPVLLLRSFNDDRIKIRARRVFRHSFFSRLRFGPRDRFEEVVAWVLWRRGPVTALGEPGARLPPLGATRTFHPDDDWQSAVRDLIDAAAAIVVIVGNTDALDWEINQIRARGALERTVFVVPPISGGRQRDRLRLLERKLGLARVLTRIEASTEVLTVQVASHGQWRVNTGRVRDDLSYELAVDRALKTIEVDEASLPPRAIESLSRPAPRGKRKVRVSMWGWVLAAGVSLIGTGVENIVPADRGRATAPSIEIPIGDGLRDAVRRDAGSASLEFTRDALGVWHSDDRFWTFAPGEPGSLIDSFAMHDEVVAVATDEPRLYIADRESGAVVGTAELLGSAGPLALGSETVLTPLPSEGVVSVTGHDGTDLAEIAVDGTPLMVLGDDPYFAVVSAGTSNLTVLSAKPEQAGSYEVSRVPLPTESRGLAVVGETAFTLGTAGELFEINLATKAVTTLADLGDVGPYLSNFDRRLAASSDHVIALRSVQPLETGLYLVDRESGAVDTIWTGFWGDMVAFDLVDGAVTAISLSNPTVLRWEIAELPDE